MFECATFDDIWTSKLQKHVYKLYNTFFKFHLEKYINDFVFIC